MSRPPNPFVEDRESERPSEDDRDASRAGALSELEEGGESHAAVQTVTESPSNSDAALSEREILVAVRHTSMWRLLESSIAARESVLRQLQSDLDRTRTTLEQAVADRQRLAVAIASFEAQAQRVAGEHAAERANLQQRIDALLAQQKEASPAGLQTAEPHPKGGIEAALDERQILAAVRDTSVWRLLEVSIGEREVLLSELQSDLDETRTKLEESVADRRELAASIRDLEERQQQLIAEYAAERASLERRIETLVAEHQLELQAAQLAVEHQNSELPANASCSTAPATSKRGAGKPSRQRLGGAKKSSRASTGSRPGEKRPPAGRTRLR